jgi:cytoskeletal protein CcmA (bactofilin family)
MTMGSNGSGGNGHSTRRGNVIDEGSTFKGVISGNSTVTVRGVLEGEVEGPALEVEQGGVLIGKAKVTELRSRGELAGQFDANDVELSGKVRDDTIIRAAALLVSPTLGAGSDGAEPQAVFGGCQLEVGEVPSKDEIIKRVLAAGKAEGSVFIGVGAPTIPPSVPPPTPPGPTPASEPDGSGNHKRKRPPTDRPTEGGV